MNVPHIRHLQNIYTEGILFRPVRGYIQLLIKYLSIQYLTWFL